MRSEFISPFIRAAVEVLTTELGTTPRRGPIRLDTGPCSTQDVLALIGVAGPISGTALYGMSTQTACAIVAHILGQEFPTFDELAESGIGELGNVITGRAAVLLAEAGYPADLAAPLVLTGAGVRLTSLDVPRLVVPLETIAGRLEIQVALKETSVASATRRIA